MTKYDVENSHRWVGVSAIHKIVLKGEETEVVMVEQEVDRVWLGHKKRINQERRWCDLGNSRKPRLLDGLMATSR